MTNSVNVKSISLVSLYSNIVSSMKTSDTYAYCSMYGLYKARGGKRVIKGIEDGDRRRVSLYLAYRSFYSIYLNHYSGSDLVKTSDFANYLTEFYGTRDIRVSLRSVRIPCVGAPRANFCYLGSGKWKIEVALERSYIVSFGTSSVDSQSNAEILSLNGTAFDHAIHLCSILAGARPDISVFSQHLRLAF